MASRAACRSASRAASDCSNSSVDSVNEDRNPSASICSASSKLDTLCQSASDAISSLLSCAQSSDKLGPGAVSVGKLGSVLGSALGGELGGSGGCVGCAQDVTAESKQASKNKAHSDGRDCLAHITGHRPAF
jgi:hypothetical protein